jgi:hypothetical protein
MIFLERGKTIETENISDGQKLGKGAWVFQQRVAWRSFFLGEEDNETVLYSNCGCSQSSQSWELLLLLYNYEYVFIWII